MVQRKVPNKLGTQTNLKTPSFQHQEIKNKGTELKKTMKKSGSFKRPETETPHSSNIKKQIKHPQPGKPPPENNPATPKKPSPIKSVMDTTPNYMKSTTSSDARKDRGLQVRSRSPKKSSDSKTTRINSLNSNRKPSSNSANKAVRTSAKKCPQMIFCEILKVQRATCSSTIKDHKFPAYLTLSPGATEAEGTYNMNLCPYTYCSLNGHHHHPLPPLKSFMLAKRRILKARNIKLGCLSPRRKKPVQNTMEEAEVQQLDPNEHGEYFIEIYSKEKEDLSDIKVFADNQDGFDSNRGEDQQSSLGDLLDTHLEKKQNIGVGEKIYSPNTQGKIELDFLDFLCEMEIEGAPSIQSEDTDSESYYVDRDAGVCIGSRKSIKIDDLPLDNALFLDGVGEVCDESFTCEIMQELTDNENAYEAWSGDDDYEFISSHKNIYDDQKNSMIFTDESDDHLDDMVTADSTSLEIDEHGIGMMKEAEFDDAFLQKTSQETEDFKDVGIQAFEKPRAMSENPMEKLTNSIGIQTENEDEYQHDISWKLDEVQKRSIGTQTDFEDEPNENICFQMDQVDSGNMNEEEGKESIDGIENITLLQNSDEDINETVAGDADNGFFAEEDNVKESGLNGGVAELALPSIDRTQESSGTKSSEKNAADCSTEEIAKHNRIIKGNNKVIGENDEQMEFNPRGPNFLPLKPDPNAEKVDLRHLTLDEKRNADDWMVDHALQQALSKLAKARKKKVALLVAAFEAVAPTPNESRVKFPSTAFAQGKRVLA